MKTDYGLIALKHIAALPEGHLANAREIAERFNLPPNLLAKILQSLSQSGIIEAHKGSGGGYRMVKRPADVSLAQVFESIEGPDFTAIEGVPLMALGRLLRAAGFDAP